MRRLLHAGQQRRQQPVLGVDQPLPVVVGQLVLVGHGQRPGRARLDAQPATDAAQVVDLVVLAVPLAGRVALLLGVVTALDEDRVRRAGPGAQLAADALLQAVGMPVQLVTAVVAGRRRQRVARIVLGDHRLEHGGEGDAETLDGIKKRHCWLLRWCRRRLSGRGWRRSGVVRMGGIGTADPAAGPGRRRAAARSRRPPTSVALDRRQFVLVLVVVVVLLSLWPEGRGQQDHHQRDAHVQQHLPGGQAGRGVQHPGGGDQHDPDQRDRHQDLPAQVMNWS